MRGDVGFALRMLAKTPGFAIDGVSAHNFSVYALVLFVLSAAALVASYLPARRAMKIDPMVVLRYE